MIGDSAEATVRALVQAPMQPAGSVSVTAPVRSDADMCTVATPRLTARLALNETDGTAALALRLMVLYPTPFQYETVPPRLIDGAVAVTPAHVSSTSL